MLSSHSLRLEKALGSRLQVLAIVDPDTTRAALRKSEKQEAGITGYEDTQICSHASEVALHISDSIDLLIVGVPPHFRGSVLPPADLELSLLKTFPQAKRWLIEKPVSARQISNEAGQLIVAAALEASSAVIGVGYMLRALKGVATMQKMIEEKGLVVMSTRTSSSRPS